MEVDNDIHSFNCNDIINNRNHIRKEKMMEEIIRMLRAMNDNESNNVFAREIALLCEENDKLRAELREVKMMIENNNNKKIKNN